MVSDAINPLDTIRAASADHSCKVQIAGIKNPISKNVHPARPKQGCREMQKDLDSFFLIKHNFGFPHKIKLKITSWKDKKVNFMDFFHRSDPCHNCQTYKEAENCATIQRRESGLGFSGHDKMQQDNEACHRTENRTNCGEIKNPPKSPAL